MELIRVRGCSPTSRNFTVLNNIPIWASADDCHAANAVVLFGRAPQP